MVRSICILFVHVVQRMPIFTAVENSLNKQWTASITFRLPFSLVIFFCLILVLLSVIRDYHCLINVCNSSSLIYHFVFHCHHHHLIVILLLFRVSCHLHYPVHFLLLLAPSTVLTPPQFHSTNSQFEFQMETQLHVSRQSRSNFWVHDIWSPPPQTLDIPSSWYSVSPSGIIRRLWGKSVLAAGRWCAVVQCAPAGWTQLELAPISVNPALKLNCIARNFNPLLCCNLRFTFGKLISHESSEFLGLVAHYYTSDA
jgi:hypothetical protein